MKQISDTDFDLLVKIKKAIGFPDVDVVKDIIKWRPKKQKYYFSQDGNVYKTSVHDNVNIGRERSTEELCKIASDRTIRANLISAWLDENGSGEKVFIENIDNYYIYNNGEWYKNYTQTYYPDRILMSKKDAVAICEVLNSREVEL